MAGKPIEPSDRFVVQVSEDGLKITLTLKNCTLEETAEFTAQIDDNQYGTKTSSAQLKVNGKLYIPCIVNMLYEQQGF